MIVPFIGHELFAVNPNCNITEESDDYIIIDNFYLKYEEIHNILCHMPVPAWKYNSNSSRNFIDYYDCRPQLLLSFTKNNVIEHEQVIYNIIASKWREKSPFAIKTSALEFNYFKLINSSITEDFQFYPHKDGDYTAIIYLDKISNGGTAFYEDNEHSCVNYLEKENLFVDVSNLKKTIIQSAPNRLLIFKGTKVHGGYINDHSKFMDNWRINQVVLFAKQSSQNNC